MIKKIIKALKFYSEISDWKIVKSIETSDQAYFVLGNLETKRKVDTSKYEVTIYKRVEDGIKDATFIIHHECSVSEVKKHIEDALKALEYIKNKDYQLVKGTGKRSFKAKKYEKSSNEMITEIIDVYKKNSSDVCLFNAVEIFINSSTITVVNSLNVNLTKSTNEIIIESIPSFNGKEKVELYSFFRYEDYDLSKIENDAIKALEKVKIRSAASKIKDVETCDIILNDSNILSFIRELVGTLNYQSVFMGNNLYKIDDMIQSNDAANLISVALNRNSKYDAFDQDGVILNKKVIINSGKVISYYGNNRYANYLNIEPTGNLSLVELKKGNKTYNKLCKGDYIEVYAMSGLQLDIFNGYIGGEVRLAVYHKNGEDYPISGFSFSGNIKEVLNTLELSKEIVSIHGYNGPKYMKIKNMNIVS